MGFAMFDIDDVKVGDILVCGKAPYRQFFYVHNVIISEGKITMSGCSEHNQDIFRKDNGWRFDKVASEDEVRLFYKRISDLGLKFDKNKGLNY